MNEFEITAQGITILGKFEGQTGIMSGTPVSAGERFKEVMGKLR